MFHEITFVFLYHPHHWRRDSEQREFSKQTIQRIQAINITGNEKGKDKDF